MKIYKHIRCGRRRKDHARLQSCMQFMNLEFEREHHVFQLRFFSAGLQEHAVLLRELLRWVSLRSIYAFMYSLCEFLFMEYVSMLVCSLN